MPSEKFLVEADDVGIRLDIYLSKLLTQKCSRSQIKKMIDVGDVRVGGKEVTAHYKIKEQDQIEVEFQRDDSDETRAEDIPIEVIMEDEDIVLVNKPPGMVVHPAYGNLRHTLVNALLYHFKNLSTIGGPIRPGIVHRLDKYTSGIMIVAKNDYAHAFLAKQFKDQSIERIYRVVVRGVVQHNEGVCEEPVGRAFINRKKMLVKPSGGKDAKTSWKVIRRFKNATLLEVRPHTGRTHQIRVHMKHIGHLVLGDSLYGIKCPWIDRQAVHALELGFIHPRTKEKVFYKTTLPDDMQKLIDSLEPLPKAQK